LQEPVKELRTRSRGLRKGTQRDLERRLKALRRRRCDRFGRERRQRVADQLDGLADDVRETGGKAGMLE
jgi:hypothetical protein